MTIDVDVPRSSFIHRSGLRLRKLRAVWNYEALILAILTVLALGLRLYKLGEWSFWIDEVTSLIRAAQLGSVSAVLSYSHPLFYLLILPVVNFLGTSEWAARLLPALIGTASIPALYFPTRRLFGRQVALLASAFLAVSTWHLYWSQNARFYVQLMLFYNLSILTFLLGTETGSRRYFLGSSIFFMLALASHPTALLIAPALIGYALIRRFLRIALPSGLTTANLLLYVGIPVGIWILSEQYRVVVFGSGATPSLGTHFFGFANNSPLWLISTLFYYVGIVPMCLAMVGVIHGLRGRDRLILAVSAAALIPVLSIISISFSSFTASRYYFTSLFGWAVLAAIGLRSLAVQFSRQNVLLAFGALLILLAEPMANDFLYFQYQYGNRDNWKGAFAYVAERMDEQDLVATTRAPMGEYYLGDDVIQLGQLSPQELEQLGARVWIVVDMTPLSSSWREWMDRNAMLVEVLDVHVAARNFIMRVFLYDPALRGKPIEKAKPLRISDAAVAYHCRTESEHMIAPSKPCPATARSSVDRLAGGTSTTDEFRSQR